MSKFNVHNYDSPTNKPELIFTRMPEVNYEYNEHHIIIDSRNRNKTIYPNQNNYTVLFNYGYNTDKTIGNNSGNVQEQFKNIVSIELVDVTLPVAVADDVPYLTLDIPELNPSYAGTSDYLSSVFAILNPEKKGTPFSRCKFLSPALNKYRYPIASLHKLTIQFKDYDGTFYDFATDDDVDQNQLIFKIVTRERDFKMLEPILT